MIEKSVTIEDKDANNSITALEFFLSLPDDLILNIIEYDPEGIYMMCLTLGLELNGINIKEKNSKAYLEN
jgi:hypothetical protein